MDPSHTWLPSASSAVPRPLLASFMVPFVHEPPWPRTLDQQALLQPLNDGPRRWSKRKQHQKKKNKKKLKQPISDGKERQDVSQVNTQSEAKRKRVLEASPPQDPKHARDARHRRQNSRFTASWAFSNQIQPLYRPFQSRLQLVALVGAHGTTYQPPKLKDLQLRNKLKAYKHFSRRFTGRTFRTPGAPLNTTSYLMRAKKSGGIASFVSPCPVTPAVLPTPVLSPLILERGLAEEANREWGVNGYGSMNGLIRLRSEDLVRDDEGDSGSEVEQGVQSVQQLEQRLDHDLSRFVLTYPSNSPKGGVQDLVETRMDDHESHIAHLEEENVILRERLYLMQQEVEELRARMHHLQQGQVRGEEHEEVMSERSTADLSCL